MFRYNVEKTNYGIKLKESETKSSARFGSMTPDIATLNHINGSPPEMTSSECPVRKSSEIDLASKSLNYNQIQKMCKHLIPETI